MPPAALHFSPLGWLIAVAGAVGIGLSKGGLTGLGILPVICFASILPPLASTGLVLPLLVVGDVCAVGVFRRVVLWRVFWLLLPPALLGVVLGFAGMGRIPPTEFGPVIGWLVLALVAVQLLRHAWGDQLDALFASRTFGFGMGVLTGVTTMIANAAGPVANLYFLSVRLPKWNLIGTGAWLFFFINLAKVPFSAHLGLINGVSLHLSLTLAPLVVAGFFAGKRLAGAMPERVFENFLLVCTALAALRLVMG